MLGMSYGKSLKRAKKILKPVPPKLVVAIVSVNEEGRLTAIFDRQRLHNEWARPLIKTRTVYAWLGAGASVLVSDAAKIVVQETVIFIHRHQEALLTAAGFSMKKIGDIAADLIKEHFKGIATKETNRLFIYGPDGKVAAVLEAKDGKVERITSRARRRAAQLIVEMREEIESSLKRLTKSE
jgi:hypothetical protein